MNSGPRLCKVSKCKHDKDKLRKAVKIMSVNMIIIQLKTFEKRQLQSKESSLLL